MSKPDFLLCDICGARVNIEPQDRLFVPTGFQPDAAGGPSEQCGDYIDLCQEHASKAIAFMLRNHHNQQYDHDAGKRLVDWLRERQRIARKPLTNP